MIDIENQVYTMLYNALVEEYPDITVKGENVLSASEFPCVVIEEADNYIHTNSIDSGSNENAVNVMYEVNVYSNKTAGKKTQCKNIFNSVDRVLSDLGFIRQSKQPVTMNDVTKYRIVGRYRAVVNKNEIIYRG